MSNLTFEQIDNFLTSTEYGNPVSIPCGDFSVTVKTTLTEVEKRAFINRVVENSYINNINYSPINSKITFIATFVRMLTDLPIPTQEDDENAIDINKLYAMVDGLNLIENTKLVNIPVANLLSELEMCIKQEIDFKNQKLIALYAANSANNDAVETVSLIANKALYGVNKFCNILDNIEDLSKDGKFIKAIPKKKLDEIFKWFQKITNEIFVTLKSQEPTDVSKVISFENIKVTQENKE